MNQSVSHPILLDTLALEFNFNLDLTEFFLFEQISFTTMIRVTVWNGVGYSSYDLTDVYDNDNYVSLVPMSSTSKALGAFVCDHKPSM